MNMRVLSKPLRAHLENTVKIARDVAEVAAYAALDQLGVGEGRVPEYLSEEQKALRRRLRAHGRALGDTLRSDDSQTVQHLVWEVAYEHWHRMLFARFLAENYLLIWEPGAPVTLAECEELAQDPTTCLGAKSGWELAGKLAARMLPQVFKPASPVFELVLAPEHQRELERLLAGVPEEIFQASDSLGWVYQFWQAKRKDEVNASEVKIGPDELPAVTQLFTEPYMVEFLLQNSLGAWWVTRFPEKVCPVDLTYMRTLEDGTPAAGKLEGWPDRLAEFKVLDPCCGSGHFLVSAFLMLVPMRMAAEGLSAREAVDAVLKENIYGLEIDPRCVEIAVFALALAAWRYPNEPGQQLGVRVDMPAPKIACCGLKVAARPQDWEALVSDAHPDALWLRQELRRLHACFAQAPLLGSLLDPSDMAKADLATPSLASLRLLLDQALAGEQTGTQGDSGDTREFALSAQGLLESGRILGQKYHLVSTNVPYLGRGDQSDELRAFVKDHYPVAQGDLANVFLERSLRLVSDGGVVQVVMPRSWMFLPTYEDHRIALLKHTVIRSIAVLGPRAFETITGHVVNVCLATFVRNTPGEANYVVGLDAEHAKTPLEKASQLRTGGLVFLNQREQLCNPGARISLDRLAVRDLLGEVASATEGLSTGDSEQFVHGFWEHPLAPGTWSLYQSAPTSNAQFSGFHLVLKWEDGRGALAELDGARIQGHAAWNRRGVLIARVESLRAVPYYGRLFDKSCVALTSDSSAVVDALRMYCVSQDFRTEVRKLDKKTYVTTSVFLGVPFRPGEWAGDMKHIPYSDDPTQWLFHGHPLPSTAPLQVAVAQLLGHSWPAESDPTLELSSEARKWIARCKEFNQHVDDDGIVCLNSVRGENPAHERLLALLIDAWETVEPGSWKTTTLDRLLAHADAAGKGLDAWLREKFFEQHAKLFHHRPFIWHIWDGLRDGFGVLINYHKFDAKKLERLIHTYLGDWVRTQETEFRNGVDGAEQRLVAALQLKSKLEAILEGEAPHDIFVRWKPLDQQPSGWNPDLNDGVRLNVRPFMTAGVLRHNKPPKLNIKWEKDRGKDVPSGPWFHLFQGERINDHHLTLAEKRAAREKKQ